jgi:hypothetical protein
LILKIVSCCDVLSYSQSAITVTADGVIFEPISLRPPKRVTIAANFKDALAQQLTQGRIIVVCSGLVRRSKQLAQRSVFCGQSVPCDNGFGTIHSLAIGNLH